jgi:error-prone DNA polymerase
MSYAELVTTSNFSFLRGGSHPAELVHQAAALGLAGIGITDRNSFAGVVRGHIAAREVWEQNPAFRYLVGVRLVFKDETPDVIACPTDRAAYGRLCQVLTAGNRVTTKGNCELEFKDLLGHTEGSLFIVFGDDNNSADEDDPPFAPTSSSRASCKPWPLAGMARDKLSLRRS